MRSFLFAIQFLTIIPIKFKTVNHKQMVGSLIYYPVAGAVIGAVAGVVYLTARFCQLNELAAVIAAIISTVIFTRGLHIDGLSDTMDALLSGKDRDSALAIMRDPHVGVMGVLSIVAVLLLKVAFLFSVAGGSRFASLVIAMTVSRASIVTAMKIFPYARAEGKAKIFMDGITKETAVFALLAAAIIVVMMSPLFGISLLITGIAAAYLIGRYVTSLIGGITGDTLGAISELVEVVVLGLCAIVG